MSSDSELDEFYDAEDITPNKSVLEPVREKSDDPEDLDEIEEIEETEKELLMLKRRQEERRRKEDEELKKRLQALEQKKLAARDKLQVDERKDYLERRRKKHEVLRRRLHEKGDENLDESDTSSHGSDIEMDSPISSDLVSTDQNVNNSALSRETTPSDQFSESSMPADSGDKYSDISLNKNSSHPEKEKVNKHLHNLVTNLGEAIDTMDHNMIDAKDLVENVLQETQLLNDENEPDIVKSTKTRTPPSTMQAIPPTTLEASLPTAIQGTPSTTVQAAAPPIVVTNFQGEEFQEPVAPPRRKKQLKLDLDDVDGQLSSQRSSVSSLPSDGSLSVECPQSPGLPSETSMASSLEIDKIAKDLEHSLDLRSIIKGKKHIRAVDAEKAAVNSDHDSPRTIVDGTSNKTSSMDHTSVDGKTSKSSSLDRKSKTSSLEGRRSKSTSLESKKSSKSSSLEKEERRRSRNNSGQDVSWKEAMKKPSPSTSHLTEEEVLELVMVKNLDTGEMVPLKDAENKIQKCMDPLVLHIIERTKDLPSEDMSDRDDDSKSNSGKSMTTEGKIKQKGARLKKLLGRKMGKTVSKVKSVADQVMHGEENPTVLEADISEDSRKFKFKANHNKKGPYEFGQLKHVQDLGDHSGAIWVMKFSPCGRLLATGGQDSLLRIWVLDSSYNYFDDMRQKYVEMKVSPAPSQESLNSIPSLTSDISGMDHGAAADGEEVKKGPFRNKPFCKYKGHTADLLDISWSKNYFILSSSMDKTVRLWHISRRECLCTFQHIDFVTAIVFHPKDDRYFLSGSLDGKLRLWNIPDKKVTLWNEVGSGSLITTANFCHNGKFAVVGTYDGKCIFYNTEHLKYYTQIHVRSTRGRNSKGKKITGIEPLQGEDKVLVTSNDSRVRLYDLRDLTLTCKYKGPTNTSSQIKASFSPKGRYVICGSEDQFVYIWKTQHDFPSGRRDRNDYYEAVKVHNAVVTTAVFAPNPSHFMKSEESSKAAKDSPKESASSDISAEFFISADFNGCIKVVKAK